MSVLAIGRYDPADTAAMEAEFGAALLPDLGALAGHPGCEAVTAVAYKFGGPFGGPQMDLLPGLRLIANFGVGYDAIDVRAATARGIAVTNTPDVLTDDVADLALWLWVAALRRLPAAQDWLRAGRWAAEGPFPLSTSPVGRRVGVLGLGRIGRAIAERLAAARAEVHYFARSRREDAPGWQFHPTPQALAEAVDDMIVAVVGGPETEGLVSAGLLAALGPEGVLVNIARGSVIDESALLTALETGALRGAGLDVFASEPDLNPRFLALGNAVLLPHVGSATLETRGAMGALQRRNIAAFLAGRPLVTPVPAET